MKSLQSTTGLINFYVDIFLLTEHLLLLLLYVVFYAVLTDVYDENGD